MDGNPWSTCTKQKVGTLILIIYVHYFEPLFSSAIIHCLITEPRQLLQKGIILKAATLLLMFRCTLVSYEIRRFFIVLWLNNCSTSEEKMEYFVQTLLKCIRGAFPVLNRPQCILKVTNDNKEKLVYDYKLNQNWYQK